MLSPLAMEDLAALEARGLRPTPAEVVRLNALGLAVSRDARAHRVLAAPRAVAIGQVTLHELTLAAEEWLREVLPLAHRADAEATLLLFASAHATLPGFFDDPELRHAAGIDARLRAWRRGLNVTPRALAVACDAALYGADPTACEVAEPRPPKPGQPEPDAAQTAAELLDGAIALRLGLSSAELRALTSSRLIHILREALAADGRLDPESNLDAHGDYIRTKAAITAAAEARMEARHGTDD